MFCRWSDEGPDSGAENASIARSVVGSMDAASAVENGDVVARIMQEDLCPPRHVALQLPGTRPGTL